MTKAKITKFGNISILDDPGVFVRVPKEQLLIDHDYQRTPSALKIKTMAKNWSWAKCGALAVAQRSDGTKFVIDGQHRQNAALLRADITTLPCLLYEALSVAQEAEAFLAINTHRKPMLAIEKLNALYVTKDPVAMKTQELLATTGRRQSTSSGANTIGCIGAVMECVRQNEKAISDIFPILNRVCRGFIFHERMLKALFYIECNLQDGQSLADPKWSSQLESIGYEKLIDSINEHCNWYRHGTPSVYARGVVSLMNGRRTKHILRIHFEDIERRD